MTVRRCAAVTASLLGAAWGCGAATEAPPTVNAISPDMAYNDAPITVTINGDGFRPAYRFDTVAGAASSEAGGFSVRLIAAEAPAPAAPVIVPLNGVTWMSPNVLAATIPAAVVAGVYDIAVVDPRGNEKTLPSAFTSLGPDQQPPTAALEGPAPRRLIGAGSLVSVTVTADDKPGSLQSVTATVMPEWITAPLVADLSTPPPWSFNFVAPEPTADMDKIWIEVSAEDTAGNVTALPAAPFTLAARPVLSTLSSYIGPAGGGTELVVRGSNFVAETDEHEGSTLLLGGQPVTATVVDDTTITATLPAHDSGAVRVSISNGGAESDSMFFQFIDAPILRAIQPTHGPVTGGTRIIIVGNNFRGRQTQILFGDENLDCKIDVSANRIEGLVPPGLAPGPVAVRAVDGTGGSDVLIDTFTYDAVDADPPEGGGAAPSCDGGS